MKIDTTQDGDEIHWNNLEIEPADEGKHRVSTTFDLVSVDGFRSTAGIVTGVEIDLDDFIGRPMRDLIQHLSGEYKTYRGE